MTLDDVAWEIFLSASLDTYSTQEMSEGSAWLALYDVASNCYICAPLV
jgi:hypothetical protein